MASYFVGFDAHPDGVHAVHDRSRCPPGSFPAATEYLGEFLDTRQAVTVARLRYAGARGCSCCTSVATDTAHAQRLAA